jgi:hypothetical protein
LTPASSYPRCRAMLLDEELVSASSGKKVHRIIARRD